MWVIYKEFERDDATTDHIAYGHLERMTFSGKDEHLEAFVNSWDALMLTFKTKPTESHLYSADESAQEAPRLGHYGGSHGPPGERAS